MFKALEIANFYIQLSNSIPEDSIDNLKLNKLLYYTQGRALKILGRPLFEDDIEAWDLGPVVANVYHAYKCCGKNNIGDANEQFDESRLDPEELSVLIDVYSHYSRFSGIALKDMTHIAGSPWRQIYKKGENRIISNESIKRYFDTHEDFDSFKLNYTDSDIITAIPVSWDSDEDSVYDGV